MLSPPIGILGGHFTLHLGEMVRRPGSQCENAGSPVYAAAKQHRFKGRQSDSSPQEVIEWSNELAKFLHLREMFAL